MARTLGSARRGGDFVARSEIDRSANGRDFFRDKRMKPGTVLRSCATRSSSGPGHRPFTAVTRVRVPYGSPFGFSAFFSLGEP